MRSLTAGDAAPDFDLPTHDGSRVVLSELAPAHRGVIVYFYPKAATPGCTTEACDFRDNEAIVAMVLHRTIFPLVLLVFLPDSL